MQLGVRSAWSLPGASQSMLTEPGRRSLTSSMMRKTSPSSGHKRSERSTPPLVGIRPRPSLQLHGETYELNQGVWQGGGAAVRLPLSCQRTVTSLLAETHPGVASTSRTGEAQNTKVSQIPRGQPQVAVPAPVPAITVPLPRLTLRSKTTCRAVAGPRSLGLTAVRVGLPSDGSEPPSRLSSTILAVPVACPIER
jgi:hypothetical protein